MNLFVIGDVHGCYHTFKELVEDHWQPEKEILIQLGDLIDKGNFTPETVAYARKLENTYPDRTVFLRGNHEFEILLHFNDGPNEFWLRQGAHKTLGQYETSGFDVKSDVEWFDSKPLSWENKDVLISHAGISEVAANPFDEDSEFGVLWNRSPIKNIGKLQVIGHTPTEGEPCFIQDKNYWNIDTGAMLGRSLTALRISNDGIVQEVISIPTKAIDWK